MSRRLLFWLVLVVVVVFGLLQLVPYRVSNPSKRAEPNWDSPRTRELARVACFDCHSNETRVLWFEKIAPLSWWVKGHVDDGRAALNFSDWTANREGLGESVETIREGSMPPGYYTWLGLHSSATLTAKQRQELIDGLLATARQSGAPTGG